MQTFVSYFYKTVKPDPSKNGILIAEAKITKEDRIALEFGLDSTRSIEEQEAFVNNVYGELLYLLTQKQTKRLLEDRVKLDMSIRDVRKNLINSKIIDKMVAEKLLKIAENGHKENYIGMDTLLSKLQSSLPVRDSLNQLTYSKIEYNQYEKELVYIGIFDKTVKIRPQDMTGKYILETKKFLMENSSAKAVFTSVQPTKLFFIKYKYYNATNDLIFSIQISRKELGL